jgi:hypothetical protein
MSNVREQIRQMKQGAKAEAPASAPKVEAPEGQTAPKAEKAPRAKAAPKQATACACAVPGDNGCNGGMSKGTFAPGHDAKLTGHLTREVVAGNLTADQAVEDMKAKGGSALLQGKLRAAIQRETAKAERKAKATADREAAKAEKERQLQFARDEAAKVKADNAAKTEQAG